MSFSLYITRLQDFGIPLNISIPIITNYIPLHTLLLHPSSLNLVNLVIYSSRFDAKQGFKLLYISIALYEIVYLNQNFRSISGEIYFAFHGRKVMFLPQPCKFIVNM